MSVTSSVAVGLASAEERVVTPEPTMLAPGQSRAPLAVSSESVSLHCAGTPVSIRAPAASVVITRWTANGLAAGSDGLR